MNTGIYRNMPFADYRAIKAVNWSSLKHMAESPRHYLHALLHPKDQTPAQFAGVLFHAALLEPERFAEQYTVRPDDMPTKPQDKWRTAKKPSAETLANIAAYDEFMARFAGVEFVKREQYEQAQAMAASVRNDPHTGPFFANAETELTIVWIDEATQLLCKGRIDVLSNIDGVTYLCDPKGTASTVARRFGNEANRMLYHCQLAHYAAGLRALGQTVDRVFLLACEFSGCYDPAAFELTPEQLELGEEIRAGLLSRLAECRMLGRWPGRYAEPQQLEMPSYLFEEIEVSYVD